MEKDLDITKVFHLLNLAACVSLDISSHPPFVCSQFIFPLFIHLYHNMLVTAADVEGC